jgi:hypothetical protein
MPRVFCNATYSQCWQEGRADGVPVVSSRNRNLSSSNNAAAEDTSLPDGSLTGDRKRFGAHWARKRYGYFLGNAPSGLVLVGAENDRGEGTTSKQLAGLKDNAVE